MQLVKFTPTAEEIEEFRLKELLAKPSSLNIAFNESDDDFVSHAPPSAAGAGSSSGVSKNDMSLQRIRSRLRKLEATQKILEDTVKDLKSIVTDQRSYFDIELSKLRDLLLKKV